MDNAGLFWIKTISTFSYDFHHEKIDNGTVCTLFSSEKVEINYLMLSFRLTPCMK